MDTVTPPVPVPTEAAQQKPPGVGAPAVASNTPEGAPPGSLAPSNESQAGITKPTVAQVGLNKEKTLGNPHGFTGIGAGRTSLSGKSPGQVAAFTTTGDTAKTFNTKLFPGGGVGGDIGTKKISGFRGGHLTKNAKYLVNPHTGLETIPVVGGMFDRMAMNMRDMQIAARSGQAGRWGKALLGYSGDVLLAASSVTGVAGLGRMAVGGLVKYGISRFARGALKATAASAMKSGGKELATQGLRKSLLSRSASALGRSVKTQGPGLATYVGAQALSQGFDPVARANVNVSHGVDKVKNTSLLDRVRSQQGESDKGPIKTILDR